ncbi:hypothetical protein TOPH_08202 [Tolypocladium ophioglossoides CBS 100239]|uniref:Uncharacterized protein n=1 Tax=Tolypocladium ophioglossoides (strain CBS 100239) TaxID=1163406 RepID=A0A0L0MZ40_TOLOC|nr:hypothetical protein TOPH_08202 [Tolypocladium ophioglossoides CBS 100239]
MANESKVQGKASVLCTMCLEREKVCRVSIRPNLLHGKDAEEQQTICCPATAKPTGASYPVNSVERASTALGHPSTVTILAIFGRSVLGGAQLCLSE